MSVEKTMIALLALAAGGACAVALPPSSTPAPTPGSEGTFVAPPGVHVEGHRGARGLVPENTLVARRRD